MTVAYITSGTTYPIPGTLTEVECIAGGGAAREATSTPGAGGAAGAGAYAANTNATFLTVTGTVNVMAGAGGSTNGAAGGDTWFNATSLANAVTNGTTVSCAAQHGTGGQTSGSPGAGGLGSSSVGTTTANGGTGGSWVSGTSAANAGGGGAGGPNGIGGTGGHTGAATGDGGGGGGGTALSNSGSSGASSNSASGANGGDGNGGTGHGLGGATAAAGGAGTNGGGGGGAGTTASGTNTGGVGGPGADWDASHGPGGGGGGGSKSSSSTDNPAGGLYGGAGGATGNGTNTAFGNGAQGIIRVTYTSSSSPFFQLDWPTPQQPQENGPALRNWASSYNQNLIGQDALPFRQMDWPNPSGPEPDWRRAFEGRYNSNLIGQDIIYRARGEVPAYDWPLPNPGLEPAGQRSWTAFNVLLRSIVQQAPFAQLDWPTPRGYEPDWRRSWEWSYNRNLIGRDLFPFRQQDWPNSVIPQGGQTWILNLQQTTLRPGPFPQRHWPLPQGAEPDWRRSWEFSYNVNLIGQDRLPVRQQDWSTPPPLRFAGPDLYLNLLTTVLVPVSTAVPFAQRDWPLPPAIEPDWRRSWTWAYNLNLIGRDRLPVRQQDWPIIRGQEDDWRRSWACAYNLDLIGRDILPARNYWPPPPAVQWYEEWALNLLQTTLKPAIIQAPFSQHDWPNPQPIPAYYFGRYDEPNNLLTTTLYVPPVNLTRAEWLIRARRRGRR